MRKNLEYFSEWLNRTLSVKGLSGGHVARALGQSDAAISRWRNGLNAPSLDSCMQLADLLEVDPPIRVAVTAGLIKPKDAGVELLPLPDDPEYRQHGRRLIQGMTYLTKRDKQALLEAWDDIAVGDRAGRPTT